MPDLTLSTHLPLHVEMYLFDKKTSVVLGHAEFNASLLDSVRTLNLTGVRLITEQQGLLRSCSSSPLRAASNQRARTPSFLQTFPSLLRGGRTQGLCWWCSSPRCWQDGTQGNCFSLPTARPHTLGWKYEWMQCPWRREEGFLEAEVSGGRELPQHGCGSSSVSLLSSPSLCFP